MEAIALNYAQSAANSVLSRLKQAMSDELGLLDGVEDDVQFIMDELEGISSFLWGLSRYDELDKQSKTWMKQVKELAYDAEDSVDEFARRIGKPWPLEDKFIMGWAIHNAHLLWGWNPRRNIALNLKNIKLRVDQVSQRRSRYDLKSINTVLGSVLSAFPDDHDNPNRLASVGIPDEDKLEGIEERSKELRSWLTEPNNKLGVASLVGSGGIGKTTVAKYAFEHNKLTSSNFHVREWITVSKFPVKEVLRTMIKNILTGQVENLINMEVTEMVEKIRVHLQDKKYLIVLDDIWTDSAWNNIKPALHDNGNGSRIVVTTRLNTVARKCCDHSENNSLFEVKALSDEQSKKLLCKRVFVSTEYLRKGQQKKTHDKEEPKVGSSEVPKEEVRKVAKKGFMEVLKEEVEENSGDPSKAQKEKSNELLKEAAEKGAKGVQKGGKSKDLMEIIKEDIGEAPPKDQNEKFEELTRKEEAMTIKGVKDDIMKEAAEKGAKGVQKGGKSNGLMEIIKEEIGEAPPKDQNEKFEELPRKEEAMTIKVVKDDQKEGNNYVPKDKPEKAPEEKLKKEIDLILKKCRGLPLAIVTVAGVLATKPKTREVWKKVYDRIGPELETNSSLEGMKKVLILSYNDLPYPLKPCCLFLSVFPEDNEIRRSRLIRLWVAEGFGTRRRGMSAEEVAEDYFNKLVDRNLIQPLRISEDSNVKTCQVHDIMLEVVLSMAFEENFAVVLNENSTEIPHSRVRRLSVHDKSSLQNKADLSHIRSLYKFGSINPPLDYNQMRLLRVLDLEKCRDIRDEDLKDICKMYLLKYLSLKETPVKVIPESIKKLKNLQTLDIRETQITTLPDAITHLQNLAYFLAGVKYKKDRRGSEFATWSNVLEIPARMSNMKALEVLQVINGNQRMLEELGELTNLRKLILCGEISTEARIKFIASLGKLHQSLRSLSIYDKTSDSLSCLNELKSSAEAPTQYPLTQSLQPSQLSPPPLMLQTLKLVGNLSKLPSWVAVLQDVAKITLIETRLEIASLQSLQKLPRLVKLVLGWQAFDGEQLSFGKEGFSNLKTLFLDDIGASFEKEALPKLELLVIKKYNDRSFSGISGIEHLPSLKKIDLDVFNYRIKYMLLTAAETHRNHPEVVIR